MQPTLEQLSGHTFFHVWFGDYSALYLELGRLTQGATRNPEGQFTIYAGFDWRLEGAGLISGGFNNSSAAKQLLGTVVTSATLSQSSSELEVGFSNELRLVTVSLGEPDWHVSFRPSNLHLCVEGGRLAVDRRDS
jgi:hypothetical protein